MKWILIVYLFSGNTTHDSVAFHPFNTKEACLRASARIADMHNKQRRAGDVQMACEPDSH